MQKIILFLCLMGGFSLLSLGQTKKIAHASHSGKPRSLHLSKEDNLGNPYPSTTSVPIKNKSGKIEYKVVPYRDRYKYIKPQKTKVIARDSSCQKAGK